MEVNTQYILENLVGYMMRGQDFEEFGLELYGLEELRVDDFYKTSYTETVTCGVYSNSTDRFLIDLVHNSETNLVTVSAVILLK